ncbi:hypothetical protein G9P44_005070 [Scheffersomyces stipitis]|nr:hypothetical protein G9P44_005070 [Scheffersomyces stipitis]
MVKQAYVYADEILRGFQNRRLKYIRDSTTGNVKTLKATKDKNELETYKILSVARIGKLAFTVEVRNTSTEENRIIMLVNPCNVNLKSNDQLVLPSSPSQSQMINGNLISIYYKWELKKEEKSN